MYIPIVCTHPSTSLVAGSYCARSPGGSVSGISSSSSPSAASLRGGVRMPAESRRVWRAGRSSKFLEDGGAVFGQAGPVQPPSCRSRRLECEMLPSPVRTPGRRFNFLDADNAKEDALLVFADHKFWLVVLYGTSLAGSKSCLEYPTGPFVIHEAVHWGFHAMVKYFGPCLNTTILKHRYVGPHSNIETWISKHGKYTWDVPYEAKNEWDIPSMLKIMWDVP
ncbi:hypothetical protein DFH08DRAFT_821227 [Mycena albidolilacea]|uniref:Uncharacterized protein n=1 Tax=Mycena albidolilacea TaxID=1033008 RepID=A0AAD6ZAH8_9AGAR|nr:hypothetical protein DFH08DRAFT_821227 [Mycena albidolilacea]